MTALVQARVDALLTRCEREVDEGRLPGCQVAVGFEGEVAVFESFGEMTCDHRGPTFSAVKPTVSLTVMTLAQEGLLELDAPVDAVLDGFAANGKADVTLSHVLLHAAGFPHASLPVRALVDRQARLDGYAGWTLAWPPGSAFEYHAGSAHWVLADCIQEVTGRTWTDVVDERVMRPAGLGRWLAIPLDEQHDIIDAVVVGDPVDVDELRARYGIDVPAVDIAHDLLLAFNRPDVRAIGHPGGGGFATAADVALWYQRVLHDDGSILHPDVRADALSVVRQEHEDWLGCPSRRTHAFNLAGADEWRAQRGFGYTAGPRTFGHNGAKGQRAWADPDSGISLGFLTHGLDRNELAHHRRGSAISSRAGLLTTETD